MSQLLNTFDINKIFTAALITTTLLVSGCQSNTASENTQNATAQEASTTTTEVAQAQKPVRVGEAAPEFTGIDSNGKTHKLSDFKGKTVVLEWTNHECPFVRKHYDTKNMQKLQQEAKGQGVVWLSIISSAQGQQGYVKAQQANQLTTSRNATPTAVILDADGQIGRLYGARTTPHMYVIDSKGILQYAGAIDDNPSSNPQDVTGAKNYVQAALGSVLKGQPVEVANTQPYGCSVKYGS